MCKNDINRYAEGGNGTDTYVLQAQMYHSLLGIRTSLVYVDTHSLQEWTWRNVVISDFKAVFMQIRTLYEYNTPQLH